MRKLLVRRLQPRKQRANRIDVMIGESGIGKTATVKMMVDRLSAMSPDKDWRLKVWHVATQGFEDVTGLPIIEKKKGGPAVAKFAKADHIPGAVPCKDKYTLGLFDEITTAPGPIQNQIREMIDGQLNGEEVDPNCLFIGTGNPPDAKFVTVQMMDDALEKRLKIYPIVPTKEELLVVWSKLLPERIYKFLTMNEQFIRAVSPREWEGIAKDVQDTLEGGGDTHDAIVEAQADLYNHAEIVKKLTEFFQFGDDPFYYPILGRAMLKANSKQMVKYLKLLNRWAEKGISGRIGASAHDLSRAMRITTSDEYEDKQQSAHNVVAVVTFLIDNDYIDIGKSLLETAGKSIINGEVAKAFENDSSAQYDKLIDMVQGIHELKNKLDAATADRP